MPKYAADGTTTLILLNLSAFCEIMCHVCRPTHWEQSVIYISQPLAVRQGDAISGSITIVPSPSYQRLIALVLSC